MTREDKIASKATRKSTLKSIKAKKKERIKQIKNNYDSEIQEINIKYAKDPERLRAKYAADVYARSEREKKRAEKLIELEKKRIERQNKERQFSLSEEIFSSIVQGIGAVLSIAASAILLERAVSYVQSTNMRTLYVSTFACSTGLMIVMYIMSTLHHALTNLSVKEVFNRLSHSFVFLVLGSVYTSFILIFFQNVTGWVLFGIVWGIATIGIVLYSIWGSELKIVNTILYIIIGWVGLIIIRQLWVDITHKSFIALIISGSLYTIGCVFLMIRKVKFMHAIGDVIMLFGTVYLYAALFFAIVWKS